MMETGEWRPVESKVYASVDAFYMDLVVNCIKNSCSCLHDLCSWTPWWHLPVAEPEPEAATSGEMPDEFLQELWWCVPS